MLNKLIFEGNLVADPDQRPAGAGNVVKFRLAATRTFGGHGSERRQKTVFIDCTAWNGTGDMIMRHFHKGDPILVEGRLEFDEWDREGVRHSKLFMDVQEFHFPRGRLAPRSTEAVAAAPEC